MYWYQSTRGTRRPLTIAPIDWSTSLNSTMLRKHPRFRRREKGCRSKERPSIERTGFKFCHYSFECVQASLRRLVNSWWSRSLPFNAFISGPDFVAIKTHLTSAANSVICHKGAITTYVAVDSHQLRRFATDSVISKCNEMIHSFWQRSLTLEFPQK